MADLPRQVRNLRQPEYTGANRCVPCTIVNVAIALALAGAVAAVSVAAAPIVLAASLVAIYLRGYLVPGTPALTKRYLPDQVLALFDKAPATGASLEAEPGGADEDALDPERVLLEQGLVTTCERDGADEDLCLVDDVQTAWREATDDVRDGDRERQVADFLEAETDAVTITRTDEHALVRVDGRLAARWESDAALIADLAGSRVLADRLPAWESRPLERRSQLASALRAFVDRCPDCGGPISIGADTVESCCRAYDVYAITCDDCAARVLEVPQ